MDENMLKSLQEALQLTPGNDKLRLLLAKELLALNRLDEAEQHYNILIKNTGSTEAKTGMAKVFYQKGNYAACNVILEELTNETENLDVDILLLYAKSLFKEGDRETSREIYQSLVEQNPGFTDDFLDDEFRVKLVEEDFELEEDGLFEKPNISFKDVGGMSRVKQEIEMKIIKPLQHADLYKAYGKKTGGGILLYGPPGCGKTFIARATAGEIQAKFFIVGLEEILDMWVGNSEKNLHEYFEMARRNTPSVLFIDEIDALGASRSDMKHSASRHLINQFLQELDGIKDDNDGVLILGATNAPWNLDTAFRRPGRFDRIIFVPPPDFESRMEIFKLKLKDKPTGKIDYQVLAKKTKKFSGADIDAVIDIAVEQLLQDSFKTGTPKPIETKDLLKAIKKHKPSTEEWFTTARNFATFANQSGLYDDILNYLKNN